MGGIGIDNPVMTADHEFAASTLITNNLTNIIYRQENNFENYDRIQVEQIIKNTKQSKEMRLKLEAHSIMNSGAPEMKRNIELAQEKGAGAWLTTTPIQSLGFSLNKQQFHDSICLRYGWKVPNTPNHCICGDENSVDHALSCKRGGYVIMRHNKIRDLEAELMREVCNDVRIEPELLPLNNERMVNGNIAAKARLDVSGNGIWGPQERSFLDIRIMHPNAPTYKDKDIKQVYRQHEKEKKRTYNERII